jgi:hypothetical protein
VVGFGPSCGGRRIGTPLPSAVTTSSGPSSSAGGGSTDSRKGVANPATAWLMCSSVRGYTRSPNKVSSERPASANDSLRQNRWTQSSST